MCTSYSCLLVWVLLHNKHTPHLLDNYKIIILYLVRRKAEAGEALPGQPSVEQDRSPWFLEDVRQSRRSGVYGRGSWAFPRTHLGPPLSSQTSESQSPGVKWFTEVNIYTAFCKDLVSLLFCVHSLANSTVYRDIPHGEWSKLTYCFGLLDSSVYVNIQWFKVLLLR